MSYCTPSTPHVARVTEYSTTGMRYGHPVLYIGYDVCIHAIDN